MKLSTSKLEAIKEYFKAKPVLRAYLFGSYAKGVADNLSDIDLVVELDYTQKIGLQFIQMKFDLEKLLQSKVDLISDQAVSKHLRHLIDSEKQLVYAR